MKDCPIKCPNLDERGQCVYGLYDDRYRCLYWVERHSETDIPDQYSFLPKCDRCGKEMDFDPETRIYSCGCRPCDSCENALSSVCFSCKDSPAMTSKYKKKSINTTFYLHIFGDIRLPKPPAGYLEDLNDLESGHSEDVREWLYESLKSEIESKGIEKVLTVLVKLKEMS